MKTSRIFACRRMIACRPKYDLCRMSQRDGSPPLFTRDRVPPVHQRAPFDRQSEDFVSIRSQPHFCSSLWRRSAMCSCGTASYFPQRDFDAVRIILNQFIHHCGEYPVMRQSNMTPSWDLHAVELPCWPLIKPIQNGSTYSRFRRSPPSRLRCVSNA
jgi:hypothetical protein